MTPRPNLEKEWATSGSNPRPPLDALLIPGLAFDRTGNRCGRGGGYYDAFISRYFEKCKKEFGLQPPPLVALAYRAARCESFCARRLGFTLGAADIGRDRVPTEAKLAQSGSCAKASCGGSSGPTHPTTPSRVLHVVAAFTGVFLS